LTQDLGTSLRGGACKDKTTDKRAEKQWRYFKGRLTANEEQPIQSKLPKCGLPGKHTRNVASAPFLRGPSLSLSCAKRRVYFLIDINVIYNGEIPLTEYFSASFIRRCCVL
jgi:hypothetical protein